MQDFSLYFYIAVTLLLRCDTYFAAAHRCLFSRCVEQASANRKTELKLLMNLLLSCFRWCCCAIVNLPLGSRVCFWIALSSWRVHLGWLWRWWSQKWTTFASLKLSWELCSFPLSSKQVVNLLRKVVRSLCFYSSNHPASLWSPTLHRSRHKVLTEYTRLILFP